MKRLILLGALVGVIGVAHAMERGLRRANSSLTEEECERVKETKLEALRGLLKRRGVSFSEGEDILSLQQKLSKFEIYKAKPPAKPKESNQESDELAPDDEDSGSDYFTD